jgi:hypothetical protein
MRSRHEPEEDPTGTVAMTKTERRTARSRALPADDVLQRARAELKAECLRRLERSTGHAVSEETLSQVRECFDEEAPTKHTRTALLRLIGSANSLEKLAAKAKSWDEKRLGRIAAAVRAELDRPVIRQDVEAVLRSGSWPSSARGRFVWLFDDGRFLDADRPATASELACLFLAATATTNRGRGLTLSLGPRAAARDAINAETKTMEKERTRWGWRSRQQPRGSHDAGGQ